MISTFASITRPYSALESWVYDKVVGPVLCGFFEEVLHHLGDLPEGASVLDVGCGGGHIALMLAEHRPDLRIVGVDLSEEQIDRARERGREYVTFEVADATRLPFEDGCFDAVVSVGSIKHWPDRDKGLGEVLRVLRPGGRFVITEADRSCRFEDMERFVARIPLPGPLRFAFRLFYRTYVAGQSLDLLEARELFSGMASPGEVERTDNGGLMFRGWRAA